MSELSSVWSSEYRRNYRLNYHRNYLSSDKSEYRRNYCRNYRQNNLIIRIVFGIVVGIIIEFSLKLSLEEGLVVDGWWWWWFFLLAVVVVVRAAFRLQKMTPSKVDGVIFWSDGVFFRRKGVFYYTFLFCTRPSVSFYQFFPEIPRRGWGFLEFWPVTRRRLFRRGRFVGNFLAKKLEPAVNCQPDLRGGDSTFVPALFSNCCCLKFCMMIESCEVSWRWPFCWGIFVMDGRWETLFNKTIVTNHIYE